MTWGILPSALTWKVAPFNMYCNCKLQLVWSFDTLHCLMGACILKTNHLRHTYYDIFNLIFNNEWHYREHLWQFCFTMYIWRTLPILYNSDISDTIKCLHETFNVIGGYYVKLVYWNVLLTLCIGSGLSSINSSRFPEIARFSSGPASCSVRSPACWEKLCFSCIPTRGMKEEKVSPWQG